MRINPVSPDTRVDTNIQTPLAPAARFDIDALRSSLLGNPKFTVTPPANMTSTEIEVPKAAAKPKPKAEPKPTTQPRPQPSVATDEELDDDEDFQPLRSTNSGFNTFSAASQRVNQARGVASAAPAPVAPSSTPASAPAAEDDGARFVLGYDTQDPAQSEALQKELMRLDPTGIAAATQRGAEQPLAVHPTITEADAKRRKAQAIEQARAVRESVVARDQASKPEGEAAPAAQSSDGPKKTTRIQIMAANSDLRAVVVEAVNLYRLVLNKKSTPQQVFAALRDQTLWDEATPEGLIGLRLVLGFARGVDGQVDLAMKTLTDAVVEIRKLTDEAGAKWLYKHITKTMTNAANKKRFNESVSAAFAAPQTYTASQEDAQSANELAREEGPVTGEPVVEPVAAPTIATDPVRRMADFELVDALRAGATPELRAEYTRRQEEDFDPSKHSVRQVNDRLLFLDDTNKPIEIVRAEMRGKNRKGIVGKKNSMIVQIAQKGDVVGDEAAADETPTPEEQAILDEIAAEKAAFEKLDKKAPTYTKMVSAEEQAAFWENERAAAQSDGARAVLEGMFPAWLEAKDARAAAVDAEALENVYNAAERLDAEETLEALEEYLVAKEDQIPDGHRWLVNLRAMLQNLRDPSIPFSAMDWDAISEHLQLLYFYMSEDSFQAKVARALADEERKVAEAQAKEEARPKPRGWKKLKQGRIGIQRAMETGFFPLTGDHPATRQVEVVNEETGEITEQPEEYIEHSEEVTKAIAWVLRSCGYLDPEQYEALEIELFRSFQVYRGASIDQNERWFGEKTERPTITDLEFIQCLMEIVSNFGEKGHAFAYLHPEAKLADTYCYPMPITPGLAAFYTANSGPDTSNPNNLTRGEYVDYGVTQYNEVIEPELINNVPASQREVLLNFKDALVDYYPEMSGATAAGKPGLQIRTPEERVTMNQMYQTGDEYAESMSDPLLIAQAGLEDHEAVTRAFSVVNKKKKKKQMQSETGERIQSFFHKLNSFAVFNMLVAKAGGWLGVTGTAEKGTGLGGLNLVGWVMMRSARARAEADPTGQTIDPTPSKAALAHVSLARQRAAISDAMRVAGSSGGLTMVRYQSANGVKWGDDAAAKAATSEAAKKLGLFAGIRAKFQGTGHLVTAVSTGDIVGNKHTARLFWRKLCLNYAEAAKNGRPPLSPEQLETMLLTDPDGFWDEVFMRPEGLEALKFASTASISSYNLFTAGMDQWIDTPFKRFLFGFFISYFAKYATNVLLKHGLGSTTLMYLAKKGINNRVIAAAEKKGGAAAKAEAEGWAADTDLYMIGGQSKAMSDGLYECILVDLVNAGTDAAAFMMLMVIVTALGVEPPDDDGEGNYQAKLLSFDEYKIGGQIVGASWFWGDLLWFAMPAVIAIHAGMYADARGEDGNAFAWKVFRYGAYEQIQSNPWMRVTSLLDIVAATRAETEQELERSQGTDIKSENLFMLNIMDFAMRRGISMLEPGAAREVYNESGLFGNSSLLDVSSTKIFTPTTEDAKQEEEYNKDYSDIRVRRTLKNTPGFGFIANVMSGFYLPETTLDRTGFMKSDRPLITNVEPLSQGWDDKLTPRTLEGTEIDYDPLHPEVFASAVALIRPILENPANTPQVIEGSGVVIPYNTRLALDAALYQEGAALWADYYDKLAAGTWWATGPFNRDKNVQLAQEKQAYYIKTKAAVDALYKLKAKLWSDTIPYGAWKMNRINTDFELIAVYKPGHPLAGQVAPPWTVDWQRDAVDVVLYTRGNRKSSWMPWSVVDDPDDPSYDARSVVPWFNEFTDDALVEQGFAGGPAGPHGTPATDQTIERGLGAGQTIRGVLTGDGATGRNPTKFGKWNPAEYLFPGRGYVKQSAAPDEQDVPEWDFSKLKKEDPGDKGGKGGSGSGNWSYAGSGDYAPKIYAHQMYSINPDRPGQLYTKFPNYTRFDYLRPKVLTKGSREAYRREDF